jgi:hypothetical protein
MGPADELRERAAQWPWIRFPHRPRRKAGCRSRGKTILELGNFHAAPYGATVLTDLGPGS